MALPAKRRKLEHTPSDDEDDASFASFGDEDEQVENGANQDESEEDEDEGLESQEEDAEEEDVEENEDEDSDHTRGGAKAQKASKKVERDPKRRDRVVAGKAPSTSAYAAGTFKSNIFKLQVDELLEQIRPRRGKREEAAEQALHALKKTIEQATPKGPLGIAEAERELLSNKVAVPFPNPRPPKDARYKLEFAKPTAINVVGSYALKTASRANDGLTVDMMVHMPSSLFQEKDYLNYRYFYKRAYYLACIASAIKTAHLSDYEFRFEDLHDDPLKPILAVSPAREDVDVKPTSNWRINIMSSLDQYLFPMAKLSLEKNCVRPAGDAEPEPTPFYNSSLRSDMLVASYLKLLHGASTSCEAFKDACLLGSTWLRQRGFGGSASAGGLGNFEWSALMAVLLQGGGTGGRPVLSSGYSSYQLFKATLQVLAMKDMVKQALVIGSQDMNPSTLGDGSPILWDGQRGHNLLFKTTPWAYGRLRQEAKTTLTMLGDQLFDGFEASFILRTSTTVLRYDQMVQIPASMLSTVMKTSASGSSHAYLKLFETFKRGLGDRVSLISLLPPSPQPWKLGSARPKTSSDSLLQIGLVVNPNTVNRTVDHGPTAENKTEAAAFRKFWGEKSELRRFKDGSITESLIWSAEGGQSVLEQIVRFLVKRHISENAEAALVFHGNTFAKLLRQGNFTAAFQPLMEAYKQLEVNIRSLEELPLSVRQIMPADSQLRCASIREPALTSGKQRPPPANVTIQFEGSTRWPDDLVAIQRTKIAFLLDLGKRLEKAVDGVKTKVGLENESREILNQAFLDIMYDSGATFRMRIHHDREQRLLELQLKDKSSSPSAKEAAVIGLAAYKREYLKTPLHTSAIAKLCSRFPVLSGSIRLTKKWFASHLLANHIPEEVIELIVARTFVQPWPWQTPSSVQTGFLRTLHWLSRWDWRADPLIVDLSDSGDLKQAEMQSIRTRFDAWRKLDPGLNRVVLFAASNVDGEGTTWTDGRPARVVAGRMTALAKAACAEIDEKQLALNPNDLFTSPLDDYDFVLHLNTDIVGVGGKKQRKSGTTAGFKNLELAAELAVASDESKIGFDPARDLLAELEDMYSSAIVFFSGGHERQVIAGLFSPQTAPRGWKVNLAYSTIPTKNAKAEEVHAEINKDAILAEMARQGGDLVERVKRNR
jgi:U3 small nucleolar RNA-associated protein 22